MAESSGWEFWLRGTGGSNLQSISTKSGESVFHLPPPRRCHVQGLQILLASGEERRHFGPKEEDGRGRGRRGGSLAFPHLPAVIPAWVAVITPFVQMKSRKVTLQNYTYLTLPFPLRPSPAAPTTGYSYPTNKGAGGGGLGVPKWGHSLAHGTFIPSPPPVEQR